MTTLSKALAAPALLAAASLMATPAAAADMPVLAHVEVAPVAHNGPYVSTGIGLGWSSGWGSRWGGGYRGRHHRHRGSTAGDILTGILILGTVAAVANAAKKSGERRSYPQRYPYPDRRTDWRPDGAQGLEGAADMCLREVERNARAREVTRVERSASGWLVTGAMADGAAFSCSIGADGRIDRVDVGGRAQVLEETDRQYDDERYRSARAEADAAPSPGLDTGPQPDYPGGPLPGEDPDSLPPAPSPDA